MDVSRGGNLGGRSAKPGDEPCDPLRLLLPDDPEEPLPATLQGSSSEEPDPKGRGGTADMSDNGPGADWARQRLGPANKAQWFENNNKFLHAKHGYFMEMDF